MIRIILAPILELAAYVNRIAIQRTNFMRCFAKYGIYIYVCLIAGSNCTEEATDSELPVSADFSRCIQSSGGIDLDMRECILNETGEWDRRLNAAYQSLMRHMPVEDSARLREMQREWIQLREKSCSMVFSSMGEGTAARVGSAYCYMELTIIKTQELEALVRIWEPVEY